MFRYFPHSEIEIKLLLVLCLSFMNQYDDANIVLTSIQRKIREVNEIGEYENVVVFVKIARILTGGSQSIRTEQNRLKMLCEKFGVLNTGRTAMLEYLNTDCLFVKNDRNR